MLIRSRVLGTMMTLALVAGACNGDDNTSGTGGAAGGGTDGGTGGSSGTGGTIDASTGAGGGTGGSAGTGGSTGAGGARTDGAAGGGNADAGDAAPAPRCGPFAEGGTYMPADAGTAAATMSFFVASQKNMTGDLGGLSGADQRCQTAAASVGAGGKTWHAYLCTSTVNAKDRIGTGPWYNAKGALVAANLTDLHARKGDPAIFIDEHSNFINGQWTGSPTPNEHDVLTGCNADGTLAVGKTCLDWTSTLAADGGTQDSGVPIVARIGHTDGFGGACATTPNPGAGQDVTSWNSAHDNAGCNDTAPRGGAGRIYCFAVE